MNLKKLFDAQHELDTRILAEHPIQAGEEVWSKKILALLVEVGEFANELPEVFKRWSNKKNNLDKALEEYVDGLHFILSLGNDVWVSSEKSPELVFYPTRRTQAVDLIRLQDAITQLWYSQQAKDWWKVYDHFRQIGYQLGFTDDKIETAYFAKNAINHQRQEEGY